MKTTSATSSIIAHHPESPSISLNTGQIPVRHISAPTASTFTSLPRHQKRQRRSTLELMESMHGTPLPVRKSNDNSIDTLFDYGAFLSKNEFLGTIPKHLIGTEVAIIGGGVSAQATAYELMKVGLKPVIFELTDRLNGRLDSPRFHDENGTEVSAFADLGAMRIGLHSRPVWHYANLFGIETNQKAPLPESVASKIFFDGDVYDCPPGHSIPDHPLVRQLFKDWDKFFGSLLHKIREAEITGDVGIRKEEWQKLLKRFGSKTVYNALQEIPFGDTGRTWGKKEIDLFGKIGTGIGGVEPYFGNTLVDFLRESVDRVDEDMFSLPNGTESLAKGFYEHEVECFDGKKRSLKNDAEVHLNARVSDIEMDPISKLKTLEITGPDGKIKTIGPFKAVVAAVTPPSMQVMHMGMNKNMFSRDVRQAMDTFEMSPSSKLFIRTKTKFWKDSDLPQIIYGSQLLKSLYCIDQPNTENGVICINYSWAKDADKMLAWSPEEQFNIFRTEIRKMDPAPGSWASRFAEELSPMPGPGGKPEFLHAAWQTDKRSMGAFKLTKPGQEPALHALATQFLSANEDNPQPDSGVYLGSDASWASGWIVGNLNKSTDVSCSVIKHVGGTVAENSPLTQKGDLYQYV